MILPFRFVLCCLLPHVLLACGASPPPIESETAEHLEPPPAEATSGLAVTFRRTPSEPLVIELAWSATSSEEVVTIERSWGGVQGLREQIQGIRARSDGDVVAVEQDDAGWRIPARPGARVTLRYRLGPLPEEQTSPTVLFFAPVVEQDQVRLLGDTALLLPTGVEGSRRSTVVWEGFDGWHFGGSHGPGAQVSFEGTLEELAHAIFLASPTLQRAERGVYGGPLHVFGMGSLPFDWSSALDEVQAVVDAEREIFEDPSQPHTAVVFVALDTEKTPFAGHAFDAGTALSNSFALFLSPQSTLLTEGKDLGSVHTMAHEMAHRWISSDLFTESAGERATYWFSEGMAEWVALAALEKAGVVDAERRRHFINAQLRKHDLNRLREASNDNLAEHFWSDGSARDLVYRRGFLIALALDQSMQEQGTKLVDELEELVRRGERSPLEREQVLRTLREAAGWPQGRLADAVDGRRLVLPASLPSGATLTTEEQETPILGLNLEQTVMSKRVTGVHEDGPAHAAGLRDGQVIASWKKSDEGLSVTIQETDGTRQMAVKPAMRLTPVRRYQASRPLAP